MIGLVKGDAYRLAGKNDLAIAEYRTAYMRGAREPALLAGFGEAETAVSNNPRGRQLLEAASLGSVARPSAYVKLAEVGRQEAFDLLLEHARAAGGNAVLAIRYESNEIMPGVTEVLAYGTAVVVEEG